MCCRPGWQQLPASLLQFLQGWTWRQGYQTVCDIPRDLEFFDLFAGVDRCHEYSSWTYNTFSVTYDKLSYPGQKFMDFIHEHSGLLTQLDFACVSSEWRNDHHWLRVLQLQVHGVHPAFAAARQFPGDMKR